MSELYHKNKLFFLVLAFGAIGFFLWYFSSVVACVIVAAVVTIVGTPLVDFFCKIRIGKLKTPRAISVIMTLILIIALVLAIFAIFIPLIIRETQLISAIDGAKLSQYYHREMAMLQSIVNEYGLMKRGMTIEKSIKESVLKFFDLSLFSNVITSLISLTGTFFFNLFTITFLSFFFLMEPMMLTRGVLNVTPSKYEEQIRNIVSETKKLLSRYMLGLILQIILNIITYSLALYIAGVPDPLVIGFVTGVIIIIPYIGGIISMIMGVLIGVTGMVAIGEYSMIMPMTIRILLAMFVVQTIDNNIFAPLIQGKSVKAHPVEVFLVVIAAGSLGGIVGMVVAVPVYGLIKIVVNEFRSNFKTEIVEVVNKT